MDTGKILVVDDDDNLRLVIAQMLSRLGYEVASADSAEQGLNIFFKNKFDMVLSDYQMPGMDGIALAMTIKTSSPCTPVVIMTGFGRGAVLSKNCTAVDEVLAKPFTLAALDKTIRRHADNANRSVTCVPSASQCCANFK